MRRSAGHRHRPVTELVRSLLFGKVYACTLPGAIVTKPVHLCFHRSANTRRTSFDTPRQQAYAFREGSAVASRIHLPTNKTSTPEEGNHAR